MIRFSTGRRFFALAASAVLASCTNVPDTINGPVDLGEFNLDFRYVTAEDASVIGGLSKRVKEEDYETIMEEALDERFARYSGGRKYHMAVRIRGYVVAAPGIPILASPKSVLGIYVFLRDETDGINLTPEPHEVVLLEALTLDGVVGTGYTLTAEEQMREMSRRAARSIEAWMLENPDWFNKPPEVAASPEEGASAQDDT
ncbi:MAG: hypothetical protein ABJO67_09220 [Pseudoruegeria sp.]